MRRGTKKGSLLLTTGKYGDPKRHNIRATVYRVNANNKPPLVMVSMLQDW